MIGDLLSSLRSLVQVTDQLAHAHLRLRARARSEDGDPTRGGRESDNATWALTRARDLLDAAEDAFDEASQNCAQIAWTQTQRPERWLNVLFLQGEDATQALELVDRFGAPFAIRHLARHDRGEETTEAALIDGYVYDAIPTCPTDRVAQDPASGYALTFNPTLRYVSLLRRYELDAPQQAEEKPATGRGMPRTASLPPALFTQPAAGHRVDLRSVAL
ncbi:hypothetical protein ACSBPH_04400 [Microbacterium sp. F51-2R]|uniref:hypothetical protein n=1 Tax=Microbacterium sp. F51-2R TaxID=3445777 RepID=UPI003FA15374